MRKIVDTILPTTMVGSYPRPHWFNYQLLGRDPRVAFKHEPHEEAYADATRVIIQDQEEAGLDIVCDGQMYFDDYIGSIGSFCWYMYERIPGFDPAKEEHPAAVDAATMTKEIMLLSDWGGVVNSGPVEGKAALRLVDFYKLAKRYATRPLKVSVGAGPVNLAWHVYFKHYKDPRELSYALAPVFNAEMQALADRRRQFPPVRRSRRLAAPVHQEHRRLQVDRRRRAQMHRGRRCQDRLALLLRQRLGQPALRAVPVGLRIGPAVFLRSADRPVRARLRQPRHGRHRRAQGPAQGQGGRDRRDRRAHQHDRDARRKSPPGSAR